MYAACNRAIHEETVPLHCACALHEGLVRGRIGSIAAVGRGVRLIEQNTQREGWQTVAIRCVGTLNVAVGNALSLYLNENNVMRTASICFFYLKYTYHYGLFKVLLLYQRKLPIRASSTWFGSHCQHL